MKLININKCFGDKIVLNNFNLDIKDKESVALMGESGCGKTTILRIIANLEPINSGEIIDKKACHSMVFQEDRLVETATVLDNIILTCNKSQKDIKDALKAVGLENNMYDRVETLSGGMKRRVSIVRAVLSSSDICLMDEPLTGLDEDNKKQTIEFIKREMNGKTLIVVTHDKEEAKLLADRIVEL